MASMLPNLQKELLSRIQAKFDKNADAVKKISELLFIGQDAVYKRLRGETQLAPDELAALAKAFDISIDSIVFGGTDNVFFSFNAFAQKINSIEDFLLDLNQTLDGVAKIPDAKVFFAASEIPIFYLSLSEPLMTFKLYVWAKTVWNIEYLENLPFSLDILSPQAKELAATMLEKFKTIHSVELWSSNLMDKTLSQIEFHMAGGGFSVAEDGLMLCEALEKLTDSFAHMAKEGKKIGVAKKVGNEAGFELYQNEMIYTNNTFLLDSAYRKEVFFTYNSPNYLRSSDRRVADFTTGWFQNLMERSVLLSKQGEPPRMAYFNGLRKRIEHTRKRIELQL